jgi:hypothetical protein
MAGAGFRSFTAGEVLTSANVQDFLMDQAVMNFNGTAARGSAVPSPSAGMVAHVGGGTATIYNGTAWIRLLPETGGKILQIVRATDGTLRTTTSTSSVDASISVTITPQRTDSAILLLWLAVARNASGQFINLRLTDNANNTVSGAEAGAFGSETASTNPAVSLIVIGYVTPATTSPTTYKGRFSSSAGGTASLLNTVTTGQLYAFEVSA